MQQRIEVVSKLSFAVLELQNCNMHRNHTRLIAAIQSAYIYSCALCKSIRVLFNLNDVLLASETIPNTITIAQFALQMLRRSFLGRLSYTLITPIVYMHVVMCMCMSFNSSPSNVQSAQ